MTTHFLKPKSTTLLTKCFVALSGALVLSAAATRVEAATFRVDYKGSLDSITVINDEGEDPTNLLSQPTSIVGNYTWENVGNNLLSSNFKFLAENGNVLRDVSFIPKSSTPGSSAIVVYADAGEGYGAYLESIDTPAGPSTQKFRFDGGDFSYFDVPANEDVAINYEGSAEYQTTRIPDPTSVPEPASVLGTLLLAGGAGVSLRRRKPVAQA